VKPEKWYFEGCNAPAVCNYKDSVLYVAGNPSGVMSILKTDDPKKGDWKPCTSVLGVFQDPTLYIDDDDRAYMYWGSSNAYPLKVKELDKENKFLPVDNKVIDLCSLDPQKHGWERFGENHTDTIIDPFIEGPWVTKHKGKYYLQYAAPGTEFDIYGDGVYVGDSPTGPFEYAAHNPFCYKPGGFMNGAGHGSTVEGPGGQFWHFGSMCLSLNYKFERRLSLFPTFFDEDGIMYSNNAFGDYPHYAPDQPNKKGSFRGWMLLSYNKPVKASSALKDYPVTRVNDENIKSFWVAAQNDGKQWLEIDMEKPSLIYSLQVNYHDFEETQIWGRTPGLCQKYFVEGSLDGENWFVIIDKTKNFKDVPHDYVELDAPVKARYVRYTSLHVATKNLAISGLRVFGIADGRAPKGVKGFKVGRKQDRRNANLSWKKVENTQGYNIRWGIAPDKLYNSWMVYEENNLEIRSLNTDQSYYFSIESFNESGISKATQAISVQ